MIKLCPFRKEKIFLNEAEKETYNEFGQTNESTQEEFLPCYEDKCAVWNNFSKCCGLKKQEPI